MTDLLAGLQVRKELAVLPPMTDDPAGQQEWNERYNERTAVFQKYLAKANAMVLQSVERRSGPERAAAIFQAWVTAERQNASNPVQPEILSRLRAELYVWNMGSKAHFPTAGSTSTAELIIVGRGTPGRTMRIWWSTKARCISGTSIFGM